MDGVDEDENGGFNHHQTNHLPAFGQVLESINDSLLSTLMRMRWKEKEEDENRGEDEGKGE